MSRWREAIRCVFGGTPPRGEPDPARQPPRVEAPADPAQESGRLLELLDQLQGVPDHRTLQQVEVQGQQVLARLRQWRTGGSPFLAQAETLRDKYVAALWRLLAGCRRQGRYGAALGVYSLLRATTDQTDPQLVALALDLMRETRAGWAPADGATVLALVALLLEVRGVAITPLPADPREIIEQQLGRLPIDWSTPQEAIAARLALIDPLPAPLAQLGATEAFAFLRPAVERLHLWQAIGHWRSAAHIPYDRLRDTFRTIGQQPETSPESKTLYFWYALRASYEQDNSVAGGSRAQQLRGLDVERKFWGNGSLSISTADSSSVLAHYFRGLEIAEVGLGKRHQRRALRRDLAAPLSALVKNYPTLVRTCRPVEDHIRPVVEGIAQWAASLQGQGPEGGTTPLG